MKKQLSIPLLFVIFFSFLLPTLGLAHGHDHVHESEKKKDLEFIPNNNQFHEDVLFKAFTGGLNTFFVTEQGFKYVIYDPEKIRNLHDWMGTQKSSTPTDYFVDGHAYETVFLNANPITKENIHGEDKNSYHYNYFLGNDASKWASNVSVYNRTHVEDLYQGIDLEMYSKDGHLKYDYIVSPQVDPSQIQVAYKGLLGMAIHDGHLILETSVHEIIEARPYAYQIVNGRKMEIPCDYKQKDHVISFDFPNGYDASLPLIIDPEVVGATLSRMSGNYAFGHTSAFDNAGNIYNGGLIFGSGFVPTNGAFQGNFGGGNTDMGFHKFNEDGSQLIYGTYVGGSNRDAPHSIVVDDFGQLCILGSTSSVNYPVRTNAYQSTSGGFGDIVITKFNSSGNSLVGSTYIGGSASDGINISELNTNYGEENRGEIILDAQGDIYIATVTSSSDFPVTSQAFQKTLNTGGGNFQFQDGVVFKINSDLSTLFWSTYIGDKNYDTANSLRINDQGEVFVTGVAGHQDFPTTAGAYRSNWIGGRECAYIAHFSADGSALLHSTFWGTTGDDHSYFLDIDEQENVHIFGQTTGNMTITPNTYFNESGSRQFISAFTPELDDLVYSTVIGSSSAVSEDEDYDFVPVAFMVDKCNSIYFSGYYAITGLPLTSDAILNNTSLTASMMYLGVLEENAADLKFGTYYGDANHVDGGTSRFDKAGIVYQGVCSCIPGGRTLNTTPNAYDVSQTEHCDMGVFKIDFEIATVTARAAAIPGVIGCAPFDVEFIYTGQDGTSFYWDFDDGATSTAMNPNHTFQNAGEYDVLLVAEADNTCNGLDSFYVTINVLNGETEAIDTTICKGLSTFFDVSIPGASYLWQDGSINSTYTTSDAGIYWVDISTPGCSRRDSFIVDVAELPGVDLGLDRSLCDVNVYTLDVSHPDIVTYEWNTNSDNSSIDITEDGYYSVIMTDVYGCQHTDEVNLIFGETPIIDLGPDTLLCPGEIISYVATTEPGLDVLWQDNSNLNTFTVTGPTQIQVSVSDKGCTAVDSAYVDYAEEPILEFDITDILCHEDCNGEVTIVSASIPDLDYQWEGGGNAKTIENLCSDSYTLFVTDNHGCVYEHVLNVEDPGPLLADIQLEDVSCALEADGNITLNVTSGGVGPFVYGLSTSSVLTPQNEFSGLSGGEFTWLIEDSNGCQISESVSLYEPPVIEISAGPDTSILLGEEVIIQGMVNPNEGQDIAWTPNDNIDCDDCEMPTAAPVNTTTYQLVVTDQITGCELRDEMTIRVDKPRNVFFPNVFSPNQDGQNDLMEIFTGLGVKEIITFKVFDRWGELIFEDANFHPDKGIGWDGTFDGTPVVEGVYVYMADVEFLDSERIVYSGDVTVLR